MKMNGQALSHVFFAARLLFLAAFIALSVKALLDQNLHVLADTGPGGWGVPVTAEATTDGYLRGMLRSRDPAAASIVRPAESARRAIASLPADGAILFVGPRDEQTFQLMSLVVSYLSWPRQVYALGCGDQIDQSMTASGGIAGVIFYLSPPPEALPRPQTILPQLTLVPVSEMAPWSSYCSR
jgi:hypothetical protein